MYIRVVLEVFHPASNPQDPLVVSRRGPLGDEVSAIQSTRLIWPRWVMLPGDMACRAAGVRISLADAPAMDFLTDPEVVRVVAEGSGSPTGISSTRRSRPKSR